MPQYQSARSRKRPRRRALASAAARNIYVPLSGLRARSHTERRWSSARPLAPARESRVRVPASYRTDRRRAVSGRSRSVQAHHRLAPNGRDPWPARAERTRQSALGNAHSRPPRRRHLSDPESQPPGVCLLLLRHRPILRKLQGMISLHLHPCAVRALSEREPRAKHHRGTDPAMQAKQLLALVVELRANVVRVLFGAHTEQIQIIGTVLGVVG